MKKILIILFVGMFLLGAVSSYAKDLKIAYIDLDSIFEGYDKTKERYKELDNKLKQKEGERKKMVDEIRGLKDELELLSDKAKERQQTAIDEKINILTEFDRKARDEFKKERLDAIRAISNEIDAVIQDYGKNNGYDYIFSSRAFVFSKDTYDVTNEVLGILNRKMGGGKR